MEVEKIEESDLEKKLAQRKIVDAVFEDKFIWAPEIYHFDKGYADRVDYLKKCKRRPSGILALNYLEIDRAQNSYNPNSSHSSYTARYDSLLSYLTSNNHGSSGEILNRLPNDDKLPKEMNEDLIKLFIINYCRNGVIDHLDGKGLEGFFHHPLVALPTFQSFLKGNLSLDGFNRRPKEIPFLVNDYDIQNVNFAIQQLNDYEPKLDDRETEIRPYVIKIKKTMDKAYDNIKKNIEEQIK